MFSLFALSNAGGEVNNLTLNNDDDCLLAASHNCAVGLSHCQCCCIRPMSPGAVCLPGFQLQLALFVLNNTVTPQNDSPPQKADNCQQSSVFT